MNKQLKTWLFAAVVILSNAFGNLLLDKGVHGTGLRLGHGVEINPWWLVSGVLLLILWMLSRMTLLGWADLSYVLPVTSLGYVLTVVLAVVFLGESITPRRWLGTVLIVAGTAIVSATFPKAGSK